MLQYLLSVLFFAFSYFLLLFAYGSKGMQIRWALGRGFTIFQTVLISFLAVLYSLLIGLWGMEKSHELWEYAILIGAPVAYGLFVIYARKWSKRMVRQLDEEAEYERQEQEEKRAQAQQQIVEKNLKAAAREQRISAAKQLMSTDASFQRFLDSAATCRSYSEILECWDSLHPAETEINHLIRKDIEEKYNVERMYGPNPRRIPAFLAALGQTYGASDVLTAPEENTNSEPESPAFYPIPTTFEDFLEEAGKCQRYTDILKLWDSSDWSALPSAQIIREKIVSKTTTERMYGANPRRIPLFLQELRTICQNGLH